MSDEDRGHGASDQDRGQGDEDRFPAEDLEKLYREGEVAYGAHIMGSELNKILNTKKYVSSVMYRVTEKGVDRL